MTRYTLTLPWPPRELAPHAKGHWRAKARETRKARDWATVATLAARVPRLPDATLWVEYWPAAYRGDVHNVAAMIKAYIDGIADGMGCDDRRFRVEYPSVWAGKRPGGEIVVHVVPAPALPPGQDATSIARVRERLASAPVPAACRAEGEA